MPTLFILDVIPQEASGRQQCLDFHFNLFSCGALEYILDVNIVNWMPTLFVQDVIPEEDWSTQ